MTNNKPTPDDPYRDRHTGGRDGNDRRGRFEDSLADTWDAPDASVDRRLRDLVGPVRPLSPPPYGFERVVLRARRRRHRTAFVVAAASVVAVAVVAGGVLAGTHLGGGTIQTAGCDTVSQSARGAGSGAGWPADIADAAYSVGTSGPSGIGSGREVMDRKYEWAIGGVLTTVALTAGIVAGCSSSASNGPSANATLSGPPSSPSTTTPGPSNTPAPSASASAGSSSSGGGGDNAAGGPSETPSVPRCHTADLSPAVNIVAGSQGAGQESMNIKLTNNSGHTCTVYGFPGMKLEDANGSGQATTVNWDHAIAEKPITVPDGKSVATTARFDFDVPASGESQTGNCEAPSVYLEITPPDETTQLSATITGGPVTVCNHGTIDVLPFIPGSTGANQ